MSCSTMKAVFLAWRMKLEEGGKLEKEKEGGERQREDEPLDNTGGVDTLLGVEVGGRLVDEVAVRGKERSTSGGKKRGWEKNQDEHVGGLSERENDSNTLQLTTREGGNGLVHDVVEVHGLENVRVELRVHERRANLLQQELANGTGELGRDSLRLERDREVLLVLLVVGLELASKELDESRLSGSVLSEKDDDLRVGEGTGVEVEFEVALGLGHRRVLVTTRLVRRVVLNSVGDLERERLLTETEVLGGDATIEEDVDTCRES
jgi:hypothetical protein